MNRPATLFGLLFLTLALLLTANWSEAVQQEKKDEKKAQPKQAQLPQNFGKLGLSTEQKKKVYEVRADYGAKIDDLKSKLEMLKKDEYAECVKVLSDDQKAQLKKLLDKVTDPAKDAKKDK